MLERTPTKNLPEITEAPYRWCHIRYREKLRHQYYNLKNPIAITHTTLRLPLANSLDDLLTLSHFLSRGAEVEITSPDSPMSGATSLTDLFSDEPENEEGRVLIRTSGSDGAAKLIRRSLTSLINEAQRYINTLSLSEKDHIALIAPLCHAYGLGWAMAAMVSGAKISLCPPTHLTQAAHYIDQSNANWIALTPSLAHLLASRPLKSTPPIIRPKKTAMVGAGPVTDELEEKFKQRFGIGLARNYGSSETGAVFCGPPGLKDFCIGKPMKDVIFRLIDPTGESLSSPPQQGILHIKTPEGWHNMNDLVTVDQSGQMTVCGRLSRSIRRGDRWISPLEIETIARRYEGIMAASIRKNAPDATLNDRMILDLWPSDPRHFNLSAFQDWLFTQVGADRMPNEIYLRFGLNISAAGKVQSSPKYRAAPNDILLGVARAYKKSALLFALLDSGLLEKLDGQKSNPALARELNLNITVIDLLLDCAKEYGLVAADAPLASSQRDFTAITEILALEKMVSDVMITPKTLQEILQQGLDHAPAFGPEQKQIYITAMYGNMGRARALHGMRYVTPNPTGTFLEVTSGPAHYLPLLKDHYPAITTESCEMTSRHGTGPYNGIILYNVIHQPEAEHMIKALLPHMAPGAQLIIDDIFVTPDSPEISADYTLDWLTHGGLCFTKVTDLTERLHTLGLDVTVKYHDPLHNIHIITACRR